MALDELKTDTAVEDFPVEDVDERTREKYGNAHDRRDMARMGIIQELRRNFHFFSIVGYAVILGNTWEFALVTGIFSITNGGTAGAIWMFLATCFGMFFVMLSMAEMASIAPTAGGQFHWVSECAPKSCQKFMSYAVGWFCVMGWQSAMVGCSYSVSLQLEAIIQLAQPTYVSHAWQTALFAIAVTILCILFNALLFRKLPLFQHLIMVLHVVGFIVVVAVLWSMGERGNAKEVFTTFSNNGWGNDGLSCLVGLVAPVVTLIGADSSCHLSEELADASWVLPRAMVTTACINYFLGFFMTITFMVTLGDIDAALAYEMPYVEVLLNATKSKGATITLTCVVMLLLVGCTINQVTTSSRQLFAFARDGGVPFSRFLSHVRPRWDIPLNALLVTLLVTVILSCIVIGSPIAYNIVTSISLTGLLSSYIIAIFSIFWRRIRGDALPKGRFHLGNWGYLVNGIALGFLLIACTFMFFPAAPHPTTEDFNWNIVVYGTIVIFFLGYYVVRARHVYIGPVEHVNKEI